MRFSPSPSRVFDRFGDGFDARPVTGPEARTSWPVLLAVDESAGLAWDLTRAAQTLRGGLPRVMREVRKRPSGACRICRSRVRRSRSFSPTSGWWR